MDGDFGYNQILMAEDDVPKMVFRCPSAIGAFEWVVMPFGLKKCQGYLTEGYEYNLP